jgi:hypothetical protein
MGISPSLLEEHILKLNTHDLRKPEESLLKQSPNNIQISLLWVRMAEPKISMAETTNHTVLLCWYNGASLYVLWFSMANILAFFLLT